MLTVIRRTIVTTVAAAALATPAAADAAAGGSQTPSGNIVCTYRTGFTAEIACDVRSAGVLYFMERRGYPEVYDRTRHLRAYRTLGYGRTIRTGAFTCRSRSAGLRCTNRGGRGFFLSQERRYRF